jgi:hypothetical protein
VNGEAGFLTKALSCDLSAKSGNSAKAGTSCWLTLRQVVKLSCQVAGFVYANAIKQRKAATKTGSPK